MMAGTQGEAMTDAEATRAVESERRNAQATEDAKDRFSRLALLCGIPAESMPPATTADVAYGVPVLAAALERLAERLAALEN